MEQKLLKGPELAKELNISRSQAFLLMKSGKIPTVRFGKLVRVRAEDVEQFISKNMSEIKNEK